MTGHKVCELKKTALSSCSLQCKLNKTVKSYLIFCLIKQKRLRIGDGGRQWWYNRGHTPKFYRKNWPKKKKKPEPRSSVHTEIWTHSLTNTGWQRDRCTSSFSQTDFVTDQAKYLVPRCYCGDFTGQTSKLYPSIFLPGNSSFPGEQIGDFPDSKFAVNIWDDVVAWHWGRNISWGCLRTGWWGEYLGLGETG